jgi:hypothetical protein
MSLSSLAIWLVAGAIMAAVNALAIAAVMRRLSDSADGARRLLTYTLPLRLALQAAVLYGAIRQGLPGVVGWVLGYLVGRSLLVSWALRRTEALGNALRRG